MRVSKSLLGEEVLPTAVRDVDDVLAKLRPPPAQEPADTR